MNLGGGLKSESVRDSDLSTRLSPEKAGLVVNLPLRHPIHRRESPDSPVRNEKRPHEMCGRKVKQEGVRFQAADLRRTSPSSPRAPSKSDRPAGRGTTSTSALVNSSPKIKLWVVALGLVIEKV